MLRSVTNEHELRATARSIIDFNRYMTLGTADENGLPWASPVWYCAIASERFVLGPGDERLPLSAEEEA